MIVCRTSIHCYCFQPHFKISGSQSKNVIYCEFIPPTLLHLCAVNAFTSLNHEIFSVLQQPYLSRTDQIFQDRDGSDALVLEGVHATHSLLKLEQLSISAFAYFLTFSFYFVYLSKKFFE